MVGCSCSPSLVTERRPRASHHQPRRANARGTLAVGDTPAGNVRRSIGSVRHCASAQLRSAQYVRWRANPKARSHRRRGSWGTIRYSRCVTLRRAVERRRTPGAASDVRQASGPPVSRRLAVSRGVRHGILPGIPRNRRDHRCEAVCCTPARTVYNCVGPEGAELGTDRDHPLSDRRAIPL